MTDELVKMYSGEKTPELKIVKYDSEEKRKVFELVDDKQKEILKQRSIDWARINAMVIKI